MFYVEVLLQLSTVHFDEVILLKLLFILLFIVSVLPVTQGSEKASTVLLSYGFLASDLANITEKYPELKTIDVSSENNKNSGAEFRTRLTLKLYSEKENVTYIISKVDSAVNVEKMDVQLDREFITIEGTIRNSLYETVLNESQSSHLASIFADAFKEEFSTTKGIRVSALYSFQVEEYYDNGKFVKYGNVLTASIFIGRAISKKILQMDPETNSWKLLPENFGSNDKPFYAPVKSSRVSSLFQLKRRHPLTRRHQPHNGIDFVSPSGSPVFPALEGEVTAISRTRAKGKYITILHDNDYISTYDHLRKFKKGLRVGMRVKVDDQIGEVGRTGFSTGAHLHFGVMKDGFYVNPISLLKNYCYREEAELLNLEDSEE
jgi:murein DD-endopeptidase MepM/ murein hydrolase activator NlpD